MAFHQDAEKIDFRGDSATAPVRLVIVIISYIKSENMIIIKKRKKNDINYYKSVTWLGPGLMSRAMPRAVQTKPDRSIVRASEILRDGMVGALGPLGVPF